MNVPAVRRLRAGLVPAMPASSGVTSPPSCQRLIARAITEQPDQFGLPKRSAAIIFRVSQRTSARYASLRHRRRAPPARRRQRRCRAVAVSCRGLLRLHAIADFQPLGFYANRRIDKVFLGHVGIEVGKKLAGAGLAQDRAALHNGLRYPRPDDHDRAGFSRRKHHRLVFVRADRGAARSAGADVRRRDRLAAHTPPGEERAIAARCVIVLLSPMWRTTWPRWPRCSRRMVMRRMPSAAAVVVSPVVALSHVPAEAFPPLRTALRRGAAGLASRGMTGERSAAWSSSIV